MHRPVKDSAAVAEKGLRGPLQATGEAEMGSWTREFIMLVAALLAGVVAARKEDLAERLLRAAEGPQT